MDFGASLEEWAKDKPLSILQLDPADRAVLRIADERDAIQKKTFTKWVNKHLKKMRSWFATVYLSIINELDVKGQLSNDGKLNNMRCEMKDIQGQLFGRFPVDICMGREDGVVYGSL
uniref:Calponin-homology (CH) domain-containing protein n=1 Tax=Strigamia maritima TaxID=126957 RepID=T1IX61_STRMM